LVLAARELSCPKGHGKTKHSGAQNPCIQFLPESGSSKDWRRIVDERIKSKTRRFAKVRPWQKQMSNPAETRTVGLAVVLSAKSKIHMKLSLIQRQEWIT